MPPHVPISNSSTSSRCLSSLAFYLRGVTTAIVPGNQRASQAHLMFPCVTQHTRHGASHATRTWLSSLAGTSSDRTSTRSDAPTTRESTAGVTASSNSRPSSASPTLARSRGSTISPSDEEISRHDFTRNISRLQRVPVRSARGVSRDPSRRTARTYPSSAS
ncbi:hypothetical protein F5148DRAFT_1208285, partial [Russula earlei]